MNKIITDIEKNSSEFIRAELTEFKGHDLFSLRVYVEKEGQDPQPTRKGITVNVKLIPEIKQAIHLVEKELIELGTPEGFNQPNSNGFRGCT
ncbi:MAG: transcriptional regulator [Gammaproteobacteria bacterium]|jgi:hypothetical protein|nr:transcriptional regulator [Gammaproteobacteria bacterium]MBT3722564.1 transcriptional regulator [Gammaproteobacteria bacterium]MBT4196993.1 transcriptional regulator [Gammaproteobacteria bacterium]MBT4451848.1 transcriptional regulator [Gammaproteobacteria bacterium]MBT4860759.1 transcriptional regulator [Gammaproteobacteria bacterium]